MEDIEPNSDAHLTEPFYTEIQRLNSSGSCIFDSDSVVHVNLDLVSDETDIHEEIRALSLAENGRDDKIESHLDTQEVSPRDGVPDLVLTRSEEDRGLDSGPESDGNRRDGSRESDNQTVEIKLNNDDHDTEHGSDFDANAPNLAIHESSVIGYTSNNIKVKNEDKYGQNATRKTEEEGENSRVHYFPARPNAEDCAFYLRTGTCKFGLSCKFNHPIKTKNNERLSNREELPERPLQLDCKYFSRTGSCKYGKACKYNHPKSRYSVPAVAEFNFLGLPVRPGERECPYYMRTGSCKYGASCRFNHPDPMAVIGCDASSVSSMAFHRPVQSSINSWSCAEPSIENSSFVPMIFPQIPSTSPEWNGFQGSVYPPNCPIDPSTVYAMSGSVHAYQPAGMLEEFPERPGLPECSYFMKTGDCRYRSACRYHHPRNHILKSSLCTLSEKGLPLRPDQNTCSYYERYGICKFGPACKFNHP